MIAFFRKNWIHILVWAVMFLYLLAAQNIYTHFFLKQGKPMRVAESLPKDTKDITFTIDGLNTVILEGEELYELWGWAFSTTDTTMSPHMYEREVVLVSGSKIYVFSTESVSRPGVQEAFNDLNMDLNQSGFSTLVSKDVLPIGDYRVGIVFIDPSTGLEYFTDKPKKIISRTPNGLLLQD